MGAGSKALLRAYIKSTLLPGCKALCPANTLYRCGRTCKTASVKTLIRQVYTPPIKIPQSKGGLPPKQIPESKGGVGEEEGCRGWRGRRGGGKGDVEGVGEGMLEASKQQISPLTCLLHAAPSPGRRK